ncbi:MAG: CPBP family intramembrane metalloprotease [Bacteroidales bacterium]|nr:CPBP family intramembrane metalloprotease [Bacteroidales bacterium]
MRLKKYNKQYLPMLWIGLGIWLIAFGGSYLLELLHVQVSSQESLMDMGKSLFLRSQFAAIFLFCILVPFIEECSFRLWGVGKRHWVILSLVLMALFAFGELKFWGILFVVGMVLVMRLVSDEVRRNWLLSILSALCFALCHISGFGGFSLGMVLGLADIFGMALVMCWLVLNVSFWCSVLLHVLNNSMALLVPLLFLPSPVTTATQHYSTELSGVNAFANNALLFQNAATPSEIDSTIDEFYLVGEPAAIGCALASQACTQSQVYFNDISLGNSLEERVVYRVQRHLQQPFDWDALFASYCRDVEQYRDLPLHFDTARVMLQKIYVVMDDGTEELLHPALNLQAYLRARSNSADIFIENPDDTGGVQLRVIRRPNPLETQLKSINEAFDQIQGFTLDYRPDHEVTLITIK